MNEEGEALKRILIVDDSDAVRQRLVTILENTEGVEVVGEAKDSAEALGLCAYLRPDVVTLDLVLPDESGVEVLQKIKRMDDPPEVIVLTNYPYPAFKRRCLALGAEYFLNKATEFERIGAILSARKIA